MIILLTVSDYKKWKEKKMLTVKGYKNDHFINIF